MVYTLLGKKEYWMPLSMFSNANELVLSGTGSLNSRSESERHAPVRKNPPETTVPFLTTASWYRHRVVPVIAKRQICGPTLATLMSMLHSRSKMTYPSESSLKQYVPEVVSTIVPVVLSNAYSSNGGWGGGGGVGNGDGMLGLGGGGLGGSGGGRRGAGGDNGGVDGEMQLLFVK